MRRALLLGLNLLCVLVCSSGYSKQSGRVDVATAIVRAAPKDDAPEVFSVKQGDVLQISSKAVNRSGGLWYKVREGTTRSGKEGYLPASALVTAEDEPDFRKGGIDKDNPGEAVESDVWRAYLRASALENNDSTLHRWSFSGQFDLGFRLGTYFSVGPTSFVATRPDGSADDIVLGPTLAFHFLNFSRLRWELRVYTGWGISPGLHTYRLGGAVGMRYPLTLNPSIAFSLVSELGTLQSLSIGFAQPGYIWLSLGLAFNFN